MFSCLGRLGCLAVVALVVAGIVGWFTQDMWVPSLRRRIGLAPDASRAVWQPVARGGAAQGREALAQLRRRGGPVSVRVQPADLAAFALEQAPPGALDGISKLEAQVDGDRVLLRGEVDTERLGAGTKGGPLAGVMDGLLRGRQPLLLGGRLDVPAPGRGVFRLDDVRIGELRLPAAVIRRLLERNAAAATVDDRAIGFPMPAEIGDIKVQDGVITLYRARR